MLLRLFLVNLLFIITLKSAYCETNFEDWKEELKKESLNRGHDQKLIEEIFENIKYSDAYFKEDKKQFRPQTFKEYYNNAINNLRLRKAKKRLKDHNKLLDNIENEFQVPRQYIVALWGIETDFGNITGNFDVLNSLANLSFGRRRDLFQSEFFAAIEVLKKNALEFKDFKGSWAGAIGQCQFLPSTYLKYGYDYNNDGNVNIWTDKDDILSSVANYLKSLGWDKTVPWGYEVKMIKDFESKNLEREDFYLLQYLVTKYNLKKKDGTRFKDDELVKQVRIVRQEDRLFITFDNFRRIMQWNNSTYFALTVGLFADKISKPTLMDKIFNK